MNDPRYQPGTHSDVRVEIPRDVAGGTRQQRIQRAVRWLWSRGIYPGPAAMGLRLYGHRVRDLGGLETKVRNETLLLLGISRQRRDALGAAKKEE